MSQLAITPGRRTHVRLDVADSVAVELPWGVRRAGDDLARGGFNASKNVKRLSSGAICLETIQEKKWILHEQTHPSSVIRENQWQRAPGIVEVPIQRKPTELGLTWRTVAADQGDYFLRQNVQAGQSWDQKLEADEAAYPRPDLPDRTITLNRIAVSTATPYPANQGFGLRFVVPGTRQHAPDWLLVFYFGGPLDGVGSSGEYCVALNGAGQAQLMKRHFVSNEWIWTQVDQWQYADSQRVAGYSHDMLITPHVRPDGQRIIEFRSSVNDAAGSRGASLTGRYLTPPSVPTTHSFYLFPVPTGTAAKGKATGAGVVRLDKRPDQKDLLIQVSLQRFATEGHLTDLPFVIPNPSRRTNLVLSWVGETPTGTDLVGKLFDEKTNDELQEVSRTATTAVYLVTHQQPAYYARFEFTSDGNYTPLLWSYTVTKDGVIETTAPGEFEPSNIHNVSITGAEADPSHETASCLIKDVRNAHARLRTRGEFKAVIETEYDPLNPNLRSVLHVGYLQRPKSRLRGNSRNVGMGGAGGPRLYPAPGWRDYEATFIGYWRRLKERQHYVLLDYLDDPLAPGSPWKVTDVIRRLILYAGFPESMIDVPDLPIRLWPAKGEDAGVFDPLADLFEILQRLAREYLGGWITFEGNAGANGVWRLRIPPVSPYTNLASFTTAAPGPGKLALACESYNPGIISYAQTEMTPALTVPILKRDGETTLQAWTNPPEANFVLVSSTGELTANKGGKYQLVQYGFNLASFDFLADEAGNTIPTADPEHPDYLGRIVPLFYINEHLGTPEAVRFMVRRLMDIACRATRMMSFEAPLALVWDPNDVLQTRPRPLRYYDPVLVDGQQFLVRNVNPSYAKDSFQMATYEVEAPRF